MAQKLISLEEAAARLGMSVDRLNDLREKHRIYGYRDGSTWKFKEPDVDRLAEELASQPEAELDPDSEELVDLPLDMDEHTDDMVLLSEFELGESEPTSASTIIGKPGTQSAEESDIHLVTDADDARRGSSPTTLGRPGEMAADESDIELLTSDDRGPSASSTVLGRPGQMAPDDSDVELVTHEDRRGADAGSSDVRLVARSGAGKSDSDVPLVGSESDILPDAPTEIRDDVSLEADVLILDEASSELSIDLGGSDLGLTATSDLGGGSKDAGASGGSDLSLGGSDLSLGGSDLGLGGSDLGHGGSDVGVGSEPTRPVSVGGGESGLALGSDAMDLSLEAELALDPGASRAGAAGSGLLLDDEDASDFAITEESDDDLVLGGGPGSDITLGTADSGISLADPADSGLSLEQPLDLGGSATGLADLADDFGLSDDSDSEELRDVQAADDFTLTPVVDGLVDDVDSGSQVIEIDSADDFPGLGDSGAGLLEAEPTEAADFGAPRPIAAVPTEAAAPAGAVVARESPYTVLNVLSLSLCTVFLALTGMMVADLMRNMWTWSGPYGTNSALMDFLGSTLGLL